MIIMCESTNKTAPHRAVFVLGAFPVAEEEEDDNQA